MDAASGLKLTLRERIASDAGFEMNFLRHCMLSNDYVYGFPFDF